MGIFSRKKKKRDKSKEKKSIIAATKLSRRERAELAKEKEYLRELEGLRQKEKGLVINSTAAREIAKKAFLANNTALWDKATERAAKFDAEILEIIQKEMRIEGKLRRITLLKYKDVSRTRYDDLKASRV